MSNFADENNDLRPQPTQPQPPLDLVDPEDLTNEVKTDGTPTQLTPSESAAYKAGKAAGSAVSAVGSALGGAASSAGNMIQTIMTPEGPVQVETAPEKEKSMVGGEDLSDLFEPPQEEDNDMYTDDLTEPAGDAELGVDEGDILGGDMEDLFSTEEPLTPPPGRRIVRVIRRNRRQPPPAAGLAGIR